MDAVEIDIQLNSNIPTEGAKSTSAIQEMAEASITAREKAKKSLDLQRDYLAKLRDRYAEVQKQLSQMKLPSKEKNELRRTSNALTAELKAEGEALKKLETEWDRMTRGYSEMERRLRQVREQMKLLKAAGRENSEEYARLSSELRELAKAQALVQRTQTELAKGNQAYRGLADAVSAFSGAASAAVGAWSLLGGSGEEQAKIQTKLQSLIAITIGLQQVQNVLVETSTFRIQTLTKAKQLWASAILKVASALGNSTVAAKALMATITLGLSAAVTVAIALFDRWQSKAKKAAEEQKKMSEAVASAATSLVAKYEEMRQAYAKLTDDVAAKQRYIDANKESFDALGISIKDTADADRVFVSQTEAFKTAMIARAKYTAAMQVASEIYRESIQKMQEADARAANPTPGDKFVAGLLGAIGGNAREASAEYWAGRDAKAMASESKKLNDEGDKLIAKALGFKDKYNAILSTLGVAPTAGGDGGGKTDRILRERETALSRALERLAKISEDAEKEASEIALAALREGRAKKLREIEAEYGERKKVIERKLREIEALEKDTGVDGSKQKAQLSGLLTGIESDRDRKKAEAEAAYARQIAEIESELTARHSTELENRLASADAYYASLLDKAQKAAASEAELLSITTRITAEKEREKTRITLDEQLRRQDAAERIATRQAELSGKPYNLHADKEEALYKTQLEYAEKRLSLLKEIEGAGGDSSAAIAEEKAHIEDVKQSLSEMPTKKLLEVGGALKGLFSQLSGLGGEVGEGFAALAGSVDGIMASFAKGATTLDKVQAGLSGAIQLFGMAKQQADANRKAVEEWRDTVQETAHKARLLRIEAAGDKEGNIFGVGNPYARAIAGANQYKLAMGALSEELHKLGTGHVQTGMREAFSAKNILGGAGAGATMGAAIGSFLPGIGNLIGAGIGALFGGIFGATQKKLVPVFNSIQAEYGSLLKEGTKTFELNPRILADYDKLDAATKKLVDNWEEIRGKASEAQKQMRDTFKDLAGDLGDKLSQSLIDAWHRGEMYSAVDDYAHYVDQTLEAVITQKAFSAAFGSLFDSLQKRMEDSFDTGGDSDIVDDIVWFSREYKRGISQFGEAMDKARAELAKEGINIGSELEAAGRSAAAQGIARASQDDITKFNGQMTLVVERLNYLVTLKQSDTTDSSARLSLLRAMQSDVAVIAKHALFLRELDGLKSTLRTLQNEGIKIKS